MSVKYEPASVTTTHFCEVVFLKLRFTGGDSARVSRDRALVSHQAAVVFPLGADAAARAGVAHCAQLPEDN